LNYQHLADLTGKRTSIEVLAEGRKSMGPGSIVKSRMYKRIGKVYKSTLTPSVIISDEEVQSRLKKIGLRLERPDYVPSRRDKSKVERVDGKLSREGWIDRLIEVRSRGNNLSFPYLALYMVLLPEMVQIIS
jgi:hypothetical protein